ncbi:MAG TPA: hypothetical protein VIF83_06225 [Gemmatimonadaceae bacterium]|jgi:hypothetical protein
MPTTTSAPPQSEIETAIRAAAKDMFRRMDRTDASSEPFLDLLERLGALPTWPENADEQTNESIFEKRCQIVDETYERVRNQLLETGTLAEAIRLAIAAPHRPRTVEGVVPSVSKRPNLPQLTRDNATAFAKEAIEALGGHFPCMETAFPGFESQYGETDEEIDRIGRDVRSHEQRFLRILEMSGILEAALARATDQPDLLPPAQSDGTFTALAIETTEAVMRPYFPAAVAEVLVPAITDAVLDKLLAAMNSRKLVIAFLGEDPQPAR